MKVLSLFDGMSCAQIALNRIGIIPQKYFASEIDKYAIQVTMKNFPKTIQLGDVTKIKASELGHIDLLIGGSPCQGFSIAGKGLNFKDPRSALFCEYVRILNELKEINPKIKFVLENVRMKQEIQDIISEQLGVQPIKINSALVSAQNRVRLYWTNISGIVQPSDKGILLKDIIESGEVDSLKNYLEKKRRQIDFQISNDKSAGRTNVAFRQSEKRLMVMQKSQTILSTIHKENAKSMVTRNKKGLLSIIENENGFYIRKLSVKECENLQTVPDGYTDGVSKTQAYKMLGNGFTVDVIAHILRGMK